MNLEEVATAQNAPRDATCYIEPLQRKPKNGIHKLTRQPSKSNGWRHQTKMRTKSPEDIYTKHKSISKVADIPV
jgi:hypothetical protein